MTTSQPLPAWLTQATQTHQPAGAGTEQPAQRPAQDTTATAAPAIGQIRRLDPMDPGAGSMLVLIVNTDPPHAAAQVLALSNEVEMGSDTDTVLPADVTGLPFDLLVLTDVTGPAWYVQFGRTLASVDVTDLQHAPAGTSVEGPTDPRWPWKQEQHDSLMALLGECARQVIDEGADSVVDPAALDLSLVSESELARMVQVTAPLLARRRVCLPLSALRNLTNTRVSPRSRYWDSVRCLVELIPRRPELVVKETTQGPGLSWRAALAHDDLDAALSAAFEQLPDAHRSLRLLTLTSLWPTAWAASATEELNHPTGVREAAPGVWELFIAGRRRQLLLQPVDDMDTEAPADEGVPVPNTFNDRLQDKFEDRFQNRFQDRLQGAAHVG